MLPNYPDPPTLLKELLTEKNAASRKFRKQIRAYNYALTFTSVNYKADSRMGASTGRGPVCFQIHGELYHLQGPLEATTKDTPPFAQLFFYDPSQATDICIHRDPTLDPDILYQLTEMLHRLNPYIGLYKTAREAMQDHGLSDENLRVILNPQMRLILETGKGIDQRRSNFPTADEIAAINPDEWEGPGKHVKRRPGGYFEKS